MTYQASFFKTKFVEKNLYVMSFPVVAMQPFSVEHAQVEVHAYHSFLPGAFVLPHSSSISFSMRVAVAMCSVANGRALRNMSESVRWAWSIGLSRRLQQNSWSFYNTIAFSVCSFCRVLESMAMMALLTQSCCVPVAFVYREASGSFYVPIVHKRSRWPCQSRNMM